MSASRFPFLFTALLALASVGGGAGCQPHIGDKCVLNTDCSVTGTLQCDTSMPGGYCTIFNCGPNSCPNGNACYLFEPEVPGCPYNDRQPSRTAHSFCMEDCNTNSDCRYGYTCADLRQPPWNAILLDDNQSQTSCVPNADPGFVSSSPGANPAPAPICSANPDVDAAFPSEDAGPIMSVMDAGSDAGVDSGSEAGVEGGSDAGGDATVNDGSIPDASDAGDAADAADAGD
jgi:hypothetical protein